MKRTTLLTITVALLVALTASVAVAANISGTDGPDNLVGTNLRDLISGGGGNDKINGRLGNDRLQGGTGSDEISGKAGDDELFGGPAGEVLYTDDGADEAYGASGNDSIFALNDTQRDFVNCGPGNSDRASVQANDYVDDQQASQITVSTLGLSCENIVVNGIVIIKDPTPAD